MRCFTRRGMGHFEILPIIAIVALLISILLPSLQSARQLAKFKVLCSSIVGARGALQALQPAADDSELAAWKNEALAGIQELVLELPLASEIGESGKYEQLLHHEGALRELLTRVDGMDAARQESAAQARLKVDEVVRILGALVSSAKPVPWWSGLECCAIPLGVVLLLFLVGSMVERSSRLSEEEQRLNDLVSGVMERLHSIQWGLKETPAIKLCRAGLIDDGRAVIAEVGNNILGTKRSYKARLKSVKAATPALLDQNIRLIDSFLAKLAPEESSKQSQDASEDDDLPSHGFSSLREALASLRAELEKRGSNAEAAQNNSA